MNSWVLLDSRNKVEHLRVVLTEHPREILELIIPEKLKHRNRGPKKIPAQLKRRYPELDFPGVSTVSYWLKKEGLVEQRKKRLRVPAYTQPFSECTAPNNVWSIDYQGQFYLKNGRVCYPLTSSDNFSRYLLGNKALDGPGYNPTREYLEVIFRE